VKISLALNAREEAKNEVLRILRLEQNLNSEIGYKFSEVYNRHRKN